MSPEQASCEQVDGRSDLFSLGCVLYRMCTGRQPFQAGNTTAMLLAVMPHDPPPRVNATLNCRLHFPNSSYGC
jgi:serine/threonine protein kinase